jgi:DNA alkylation repair enzyme
VPSTTEPGPDARNAVSLAADIEQRLREAGDPERAAGERAYLKSSMECAGVGLPGLRGIVRALLPRRPALPRDSLVAVVAELWARPLFECNRARPTARAAGRT